MSGLFKQYKFYRSNRRAMICHYPALELPPAGVLILTALRLKVHGVD